MCHYEQSLKRHQKTILITLQFRIEGDMSRTVSEFMDLENSGYIINLSFDTQSNKIELVDFEFIELDLTLAGIDFIVRNN